MPTPEIGHDSSATPTPRVMVPTMAVSVPPQTQRGRTRCLRCRLLTGHTAHASLRPGSRYAGLDRAAEVSGRERLSAVVQ